MDTRRGPPVEPFDFSTLEERVNTLPNGKRRKKPIKLEDCQLVQLKQFKCVPSEGDLKRVVCSPFLRLFRR
jgi:inner membrane protease subunit SOM1